MPRFVLILLACSTFGLVIGSGVSAGAGRAAYPRSNRGFKNAQLSTARGFGKRDGVRTEELIPPQNGVSSFISEGRNYPTSWLVEELQGNPELARLLVDKFVDENGDGEITPEELFKKPFY